MPRIKTVLAEAIKSLQSVSDSALLDSEILLYTALGKDRTYLRTWPEQTLSPEQIETYQKLLQERQQGKPIAYIIGKREFWSLDFLTTPDVLIPRPETELLIELSLNRIPIRQPYHVLDLGTGSGIIAVTLATERPEATITATDISSAALTIAQLNAAKHKTESIRFYQSCWFEDLPLGKFDLILSNPPYLAEDDEHLMQGDLRFEPITALIADQNGLGDITTIAEIARTRLQPNGHLMIEHGCDQGLAVRSLFIDLGYHFVQTHQDLAGLSRVTSGQY